MLKPPKMSAALGRIIFASAWLIGSAGCATRTVIIDSTQDVVRLGEDVRGHVYVWRPGGWERVGPVKLPQGWWAGPGPDWPKR